MIQRQTFGTHLKPYKKGHLAAITDPKELAPLLQAIDGYKGTHTVRCALKLTPLLLARPGELTPSGMVRD